MIRVEVKEVVSPRAGRPPNVRHQVRATDGVRSVLIASCPSPIDARAIALMMNSMSITDWAYLGRKP